MKKMVLIRTDPERVFIRDNAGVQASFNSFAEFKEYSGVTVPQGIAQVNYEPDKPLFTVNGVRKDVETQGAPYEAQIAEVGAYAALKADLFYGEGLDAAKSLKRGQIDDYYRDAKAAEYQEGANKLSFHGLQTIEELTQHALLARATNDSSWRVHAIMSNTNPDGTLVRLLLTADQILRFVKDLMGRNELLNQQAQDEKDAVQLLNDVEEVKNYPIGG